MSTLRAGDREFHTLAAGQVLTVVTAAASAGIVRQYPDTGFNATSSQAVGASSTLTVGPFTGSVRLGVECSLGRLDWTAGLPTTFPAPALSDSKVAAVDSLVSGAWKSRTLKKSPWGRLKTATVATDLTSTFQVDLEAPWYALRIWLPNAHTASVAGIKATVYPQAVQSTFGNALVLDQSAGAVDATWGGATSVTLPARIASERASWTASDWIMCPSIPRTDGGTRPLLGLRIEKPAAVSDMTMPFANTSGWWTGAATSDGRILRRYNQAVLGVTTPASFTSTTQIATDFWPWMIEYALVGGQGCQWIGSGDSIVEGYSTTDNYYGYWQRACLRSSTPAAPCDYVNAGQHSQTAAVYGEYLAERIASVKPNILLASPYSVNAISGSITAANLRQFRGWAGRYMALAKENDAQLILANGLPCNTGFKTYTGDASRRDFNTELLSSVGAGVAVADVSAIYSGAIGGTDQTQIAAGLSSDNVHPNEAGHEAFVAAVNAARATLNA